MSIPEKIRTFLETAPEYPAKSKLEPYADLIRTLRRKRWTYQQIAEALKTEFNLSTASSTIHNFIKVRAKQKRRAVVDTPSTPSPVAPQSTKRARFNIDA